ncbi:hypothetical protein ACC717_21325 [Rhizobium ruizarguesonis]
MAETEFCFKINAYSPETFPMERLGQYMADLGAMLGQQNSVHFVMLREGSTGIVHRVSQEAVSKVEQTVLEVGRGEAEIVHLNAYREINKLLKEDNATGVLLRGDNSAQLLDFPGRNEPEPSAPDVVTQSGVIDGVVISLGGKDNTVPVRIQADDVIYRCTTSREIARLLGSYIYGDELRLSGEGKWLRNSDGEWSLDLFKIQSFELLDVRPLSEVIHELRSIAGDWSERDTWGELQNLRNGE